MLDNLSFDSLFKMIHHLICVEFPDKIKSQEIYVAIRHQTRNKHSDWSENVPVPF